MLEQTQIEEVITKTRESNKLKDEVLAVLTTGEHFDFMYGEVRKLVSTTDSWSEMGKLSKAERPTKYSVADCDYYNIYNTLRGWKSAVTTVKEPKTPFQRLMAILEKNGFDVKEYECIITEAQSGKAKAALKE